MTAVKNKKLFIFAFGFVCFALASSNEQNGDTGEQQLLNILYRLRRYATYPTANSCNSWSRWINDNHPSVSHTADEEHVDTMLLDSLCPWEFNGVVEQFECLDGGNNITFTGNKTSSQWTQLHECNTKDMYVKCSVTNGGSSVCPDMSVRFYCYCDPPTSTTWSSTTWCSTPTVPKVTTPPPQPTMLPFWFATPIATPVLGGSPAVTFPSGIPTTSPKGNPFTLPVNNWGTPTALPNGTPTSLPNTTPTTLPNTTPTTLPNTTPVKFPSGGTPRALPNGTPTAVQGGQPTPTQYFKNTANVAQYSSKTSRQNTITNTTNKYTTMVKNHPISSGNGSDSGGSSGDDSKCICNDTDTGFIVGETRVTWFIINMAISGVMLCSSCTFLCCCYSTIRQKKKERNVSSVEPLV